MTRSTFALLPLTAAISLLMAGTATAGMTYETENGSLTFGGDVELDINANNSQDTDTTIFGEDIDTSDEYGQTGRVLLDLSGERRTASHYVSFKAQSLLGTDGGVGVDDAWLAIGNNQGGEVKVGRFEAYDLFPLGQDVFVQYNGDTSNGLYDDNSGYIYQMKEGRGRGAGAGQVMVSQQVGDVRAELATLIGDRSGLFKDDTYHGYDIEDDTKNSAIVRPVVAWTPGPWTLAAGLEANVVDDAIVDERGNDISDRTGYGTRLSYAAGALAVNLNLAYLDAYQEDSTTVGVNAVWNNIGVGYIHADNEIKEVKTSTTTNPAGDYTVDTLYTSYKFANVLDIEDFHTYLGAYYSTLDHDRMGGNSEADRYGARLRLKYHF